MELHDYLLVGLMVCFGAFIGDEDDKSHWMTKSASYLMCLMCWPFVLGFLTTQALRKERSDKKQKNHMHHDYWN